MRSTPHSNKRNIPNHPYHRPTSRSLYWRGYDNHNDSSAARLRNSHTGNTLLNFETSLIGVSAYIHNRVSVDNPIISSPNIKNIPKTITAYINQI